MIKIYEKEGKRYYEVYVSERGVDRKIIARRKRGIKNERDAKEVEFKFKAELRELAAEKPTVTWDRWHAEFLRRYRMRYKNSTVMNYDGYLKKYIPVSWNGKAISAVTSDEIYEIIQNSAQSLGPVSQKNILKMLRKIFEMALDDGHIARNPTRGITLQSAHTIKKVLTSHEAETLLFNAKALNHRFYPVWAFALHTGMRSGEMYALRWSDVDLVTGLISLSRQWTNKDGFHELKTRDWRVVPISDDLNALMLELKHNQEPNHEFVLPRLEEWTHGDQAKITRDFCASIGITSVKFHDLRATFITNLLAQGTPLVKVMAVVGHKSMETTDEYLRLAGVEIKGITNSLGYNLPTQNEVNNVFKLEFKKRS